MEKLQALQVFKGVIDSSSMSSTRGFTLLELLIVIAILSILSAVTVIVLQPAEILAKARDAQRLSDLSVTRTAIGFFIVNISSPEIDDSVLDSNDNCVGGSGTATVYTHRALISAPPPWATVINTSTPQLRDGNGWIRIDFTQLSGGSPLSKLPVDPRPSGPAAGAQNDFYYTYGCNASDLTFELMANMEAGITGRAAQAM